MILISENCLQVFLATVACELSFGTQLQAFGLNCAGCWLEGTPPKLTEGLKINGWKMNFFLGRPIF